LILSLIAVVLYFLEDPEVRAQRELKEIRSALELFYLYRGEFPPNEQGLGFLQLFVARTSPQLRIELTDPWQYRYQYLASDDGQRCEVKTFGSDGSLGGLGDRRDLSFELDSASVHDPIRSELMKLGYL
jgi:hypothetical protein